MADNYYKHYKFLQNKKKLNKDKEIAQFDAMRKYLSDFCSRSESYSCYCVNHSLSFLNERCDSYV